MNDPRWETRRFTLRCKRCDGRAWRWNEDAMYRHNALHDARAILDAFTAKQEAMRSSLHG